MTAPRQKTDGRKNMETATQTRWKNRSEKWRKRFKALKNSDEKIDETRQNGINKMNAILFFGETEASPTHTGRLFKETSRKAKKNNHQSLLQKYIFFKKNIAKMLPQ